MPPAFSLIAAAHSVFAAGKPPGSSRRHRKIAAELLLTAQTISYSLKFEFDPKHPQTLRGSFSAGSTATIATKYSFFRFFEIYNIFILLHRSDLKISAENRPNFCWNFFISSRFSANFAIFLRIFDEILPEFHRNVEEMTKKLTLLIV